jgi:transposase
VQLERFHYKELTMPQTPSTAPILVSRKPTRQFTDDYRLQVIALIEHEKRGVSSVAKELGLSESLIYGWLKRRKEGTLPSRAADSSLLPSQATVFLGDYAAELAALRKENAILREERDILKKSVAIFIGTRK